MVVTTVHAPITAMTAQAQAGRLYSDWSIKARRMAAYPTLTNRKTASARHSGSENERLAAAVTVTITKLH
jgi:hypothetical protein